MAKYSIIPKDGGDPKYTGYLTYNGPYMKPAYVEFNRIESPVPIHFEVGDYVVYDRIGLEFRLHYIPTPKKQARTNTYGAAFVYENVQLFADTKDLEKTPFQDMSIEDDVEHIHFSSRNSASTFENVYGIARRIQACMDAFHPGGWHILVSDPHGDVDISEAKDFTIDGSCLDALSRIYETWDSIGWIHTVENGVNVITIGAPNTRSSDNTSDPFLYGKGNGLRTIKMDVTNRDEIVTRLYPFGSERNLPNRYYNGKTIRDAESVDIKHLMPPISVWGKTPEGGLNIPDPAKAYVEPSDPLRVARYGIIPKRVWFDGSDGLEEIYPTIERVTIGEVTAGLDELGETDYVPDPAVYPDEDTRVDEVVWATEIEDSGVIGEDGKSTVSLYKASVSAQTRNWTAAQIEGGAEVSFVAATGPLSVEANKPIRLRVTPEIDQLEILSLDTDLIATITIGISGSEDKYQRSITPVKDPSAAKYYLDLPELEMDLTPESSESISLLYQVLLEGVTKSIVIKNKAGIFRFGSVYPVAQRFQIRIPQIGFDLNDRAAQGGGMTISMKDGACGGRSFPINKCVYEGATDSWLLTLTRQEDPSTDVLYPNGDGYNIAAGDHFVLLDIAMPELYIAIAENRLLIAAQSLIDELSAESVRYEPEIDAIVMANESRSIREGMYMEVTDVDVIGGTDYVLIDSLTISEGEAVIPTYKVVLRDKKRLSLSQTINQIRTIGASNSASIQDNTQEIRKLAKSKQSDSGQGGKTSFPLVYSEGSMSGFTEGVFDGSSKKTIVIPSTFDHLTSHPTTVQGYGITDAVDTTSAQRVGGAKTFNGMIRAGDGILLNGHIYAVSDNQSNIGMGSNRFAAVNSATGYFERFVLRDQTGEIDQAAFQSENDLAYIVLFSKPEGSNVGTSAGALFISGGNNSSEYIGNNAIYWNGNDAQGFPKQISIGLPWLPFSAIYVGKLYLDEHTWLEKDNGGNWHLKTDVSGGSVNFIVDGDIACG